MPTGGNGSHEGAVAHHATDCAAREAGKPQAHAMGLPHPGKAADARLGCVIRAIERELHEVIILGRQGEGQVTTVDVARDTVVGAV